MLLSSTLNGNWVTMELGREFFSFLSIYEKNVTCKRDPEARDPEETETFDFQSETRPRPRHSHISPRPRPCEMRPRRWENASRDRLETETSRPRLHPCPKLILSPQPLHFLNHRCWCHLANILKTYCKQASRQNVCVWNSHHQHAAQLFQTTP